MAARIRRAGGLMSASFDYAGISSLVQGVTGDVRSAGPAILAAHKTMASTLQRMQADEAIDLITEHRRAQRRPVSDGPLVHAVLSPKNRSSDVHGYTVGFLSDKGKFPGVARYAQGLEEGTDVHVGQRMAGLWVTANGLQPPIEGALDAIGFRSAGRIGRYNPQPPRQWVIHNAIIGIGFQRRGYDKFVAAGWNGTQAISEYKRAFRDRGLGFISRLLGADLPAPRPSSVRASSTLLDASYE